MMKSPAALKISRRQATGISIVELLVALAILGVMSLFAITKVFNAGGSNKENIAKVKSAASILSYAYAQYRQNATPTGSTTAGVLTPYLNYVKLISNSSLSINDQTGAQITCNGTNNICLQLHNGSTLGYKQNMAFGNTGSTNAWYFWLDPDGSYTPSSPSVQLFVYYDGLRTTSRGSIKSKTYNMPDNTALNPSADPSWFSW